MQNMTFRSRAAGVANANENNQNRRYENGAATYLGSASGDLQGSNAPSPPRPVTAFGYFGTNGEGWLSHDGLDAKLAHRSPKGKSPASRALQPQHPMCFGARTAAGGVSPSTSTGSQYSQAPQYFMMVFSASTFKKMARSHLTLHGSGRMPSNLPLLEWRLSELKINAEYPDTHHF